MANPLDPNAVERALERCIATAVENVAARLEAFMREPFDGPAERDPVRRILRELVADAATRAAELSNALDALILKRNQEGARAAELERELASLKERYDALHDARHAEARKADAAIARAESLTTDLHEMREAAQEEQRRVWADGQKAVDSARRERDQLRARVAELEAEKARYVPASFTIAAEVDQLRAERDRLHQDNATFHDQLAAQVKELIDLRTRLAAAEERAEKVEQQNSALIRDAGYLERLKVIRERDAAEQDRDKWAGEYLKLKERLAAAEGALRPFRIVADAYEDKLWPDRQEVLVMLGDCRAARAALAPSTGEPFSRGFGALPPEDEQ